MKRTLFWKLAVGAAVLSLTACGAQETEMPKTQDTAVESSAEASASSQTESVADAELGTTLQDLLKAQAGETKITAGRIADASGKHIFTALSDEIANAIEKVWLFSDGNGNTIPIRFRAADAQLSDLKWTAVAGKIAEIELPEGQNAVCNYDGDSLIGVSLIGYRYEIEKNGDNLLIEGYNDLGEDQSLRETIVLDKLNRVVSYSYSEGSTLNSQYTYSANGKLKTILQENMGSCEQYVFDDEGMILTQKSWEEGQEPEQITDANLPISVLQKEVDVDGDGENEMIYLAANLMNTEYVLSVRKSNGDTIFFDAGEQEFTLEDLRLETMALADGKGLFYIESSLGSDWADYCIYGYQAGEIKCFGVISAYMFGMECDGSVLSTLGGMYTIQSDFVTNRYAIDWNAGTLTFIEEEHEFDVQNWNDGAFVTSSVQELTLHTEADAKSDTIVLKPQKIKFLKIDATNNWIYIFGKDGNGGWLYKDGDWAQWQKYFTELTFFG